MDNPSGKYIEGKEIEVSDIGSKVTQIPRHDFGNASHPDAEGGRIKRWTEDGVFVDYTRNVCRTDFKDLVWG